MMHETPLVTVVAVCYNHERFVEECLEGIRCQSYPSIQLIIMDDSSTDLSVSIIENWIKSKHVNCQFITHKENLGLCKTLNQALTMIEGKYVSFLSTDDVWLPDFITKNVEILEGNPDDAGLVYGNSYLIDESGDLLPKLRKENNHHPQGYVLKEFLDKSFIATNAVLIRSSCFRVVGNYDESLFYEDFDMWTRLLAAFKVVYCPEILAKYRIVQSSMVNSKKKQLYDSYIEVLTKLKETHPDCIKEIENRMALISQYLYATRHPERNRYLKLAYQNKKTKWHFTALVFSYLHIPYQTFLKTTSKYYSLRDKGNQ